MRLPLSILGALLASSAALADAPKMPKALRCEFESNASGTAEPTNGRITATIKQEPGIDPLTFAALDSSKEQRSSLATSARPA